MKKIQLLAALVLLQGCEFSIIRQDQTQQLPSVGGIYACAVVFPEGYNWRKDSLGGGMPRSLMLFKDRETILELPVSVNNSVREDMDMHTLAEGHLYTFCPSERGTVIKKDGIGILNFDEPERIEDFLLDAKDIYTVSVPLGGSGWRLRRNGVEMIRQETGHPAGRLHKDSGNIYLPYCKPLENSNLSRYYLFRDSLSTLINHGGDIAEIHAVRIYDGVLNIIASLYNADALVWQRGDDARVIDSGCGGAWRDIFFDCSSACGVFCHFQTGAAISATGPMQWQDRFILEDGTVISTAADHQLCAMCHDGEKLCFAHSRAGGTNDVALFFDGKQYTMPQRYIMISPYAVCCDRKNACIGLCDTGNACSPVIVRGADTLRYDFNGYFTCLCLP